MALQFRRYAGAQIFAFDFGGSIRAAALAMGGDWHDLGGALADDLAEPVALQPLSRIDDAGERAWAAEWVATLLAREAVTVTPELKEHLWSALTSLASAPASERTITGLSVLLQSNALKQALQPYTVGGPWGRLLDAESERLGEAEVQAFETEGLIGAGAAPAVLSYLFHRIEDRFDGRPTLLIVDEGWLALDDRGFAGQLREWLKTLRKKNASVIFATQSLADIDGSAIAPAIIESCPTRLFLPNERALEPQIATIYRRFGLNDRQIEILSRATPKRDYYCQSRRGNRLFELGLSEVGTRLHRGVLQDRPRRPSQLIVAAEGRDRFAAAWLRGKGLDWAAEGEDALLAGGMCLEPRVFSKERRIELPRNLALVPALHQDDLLPKLGPAHHGPPRKRMSRREHGHQPVAKERHARDSRPQGLGRGEDDVQVSFLDLCHEVPVAQFRYGQDDVRVPCPPSGQQGQER